MKREIRYSVKLITLSIALLIAVVSVSAQSGARVLDRDDAKLFVPEGFYFEGQSAATQMRNSGVAILGEKRHVIVGLVDTSGYSADIAKLEEKWGVAPKNAAAHCGLAG